MCICLSEQLYKQPICEANIISNFQYTTGLQNYKFIKNTSYIYIYRTVAFTYFITVKIKYFSFVLKRK